MAAEGFSSSNSAGGGVVKATIVSSFINLANTILGSGMLGLPYAAAHCGWILATALMLFCALASSFALHCLSCCALQPQHIGKSSFYSVTRAVMPHLTSLIDVAVAIKCFGVATSYLIVIGDLMPQVMEQFGASAAAQNRQLWVAIGFVVVAPLSFMHNLDSLKFTSLLSIIFVALLTLLISLYAMHAAGLDGCDDIDDGDTCKGSTSLAQINMGTLKVMSIFVFGFTCQQNIFAVCNELETPNISRLNTVIACAIGTAVVVYMIVAFCGYYTFGDEVESDILVSYPENYIVSTARVFVSLLVAFSYPLQAHPARQCICTLWDTVANRKSTATTGSATAAWDIQKPNTGLDDASVPLVDREEVLLDDGAWVAKEEESVVLPRGGVFSRHTLVTTVFLGLSLAIGLSLNDLGVMLSIVGATGSTIVSYILPGLLYYLTYTFGDALTVSDGGQGRGATRAGTGPPEGPAWKRYAALGQAILGFIIMPFCLACIFI